MNQKEKVYFNYYKCNNEKCQKYFAFLSTDNDGPCLCPECGTEASDTGQVIVDEKIMSKSNAVKQKLI